MRRLDANQALEALRCLRLRYRPDLRQPDGLWLAQCPLCVAFTEKATLTIIESRRGARVSLRCGSRDCVAADIETRLREALLPVGRPLEIAEAAVRVAHDALRRADVLEHRLAQLEADRAPLAVGA